MKSLLVLAMVLSAFPSPAADQFSATVLATIKDATVYIKTPNGCCSGFLVASNAKTGWLATSAHVVAGSGGKVEVVFMSGSNKERSLSARLTALDISRNLAFLCISDEQLPRPMNINGQANPEETMPVWVVGFPFDYDGLAINQGNPAPTITPMLISSLHRDTYGNLDAIQTGGINAGNSGAPLINSKGAVVGVYVANNSGPAIGVGIPLGLLRDSLAGRVIRAQVSPASMPGSVPEFLLTATCVDPINNLCRITALMAPAPAAPIKPKVDAKGRVTSSVIPGMKEQDLTYTDQKATGSIKMQMPKGASRLVVQFRYHRKDGTSAFSDHTLFDLDGNELSATGVVRNRRDKDAPPIVAYTYIRPTVVPVTPLPGTSVTGKTERDVNGRSYTAVTAIGIPFDLGKDLLQVACNATGNELYIIHKDDPAIKVVDPITRKTLIEIPVPQSPASIWADDVLVGVACGKSQVVALIDTKKRALIASGSHADLKNHVPDTIIGRAPDGSVMSLWRLTGGAWWDRALVHTTVDGKTNIMINGEGMYWATWLKDGTGVISQGDFSSFPPGTFDLAFPAGPKNYPELLHNKRLLDGFITASGQAFMTADRKAIVWRRFRKTDHRQGPPWTYLISHDFDTILFDFPGSAILEIPEQHLFISVGFERGGAGPAAETWPVCYYISSADGRILRQIKLLGPNGTPFENNQFLCCYRPDCCCRRVIGNNSINCGAVFIPGHELLLLPDFSTTNGVTGVTYTAFRCGPVVDAIQVPSGPVVDVPQTPAVGAPSHDPPAKAAVGERVSYSPKLNAKATDFRLKRPPSGMTVDPVTGTWVWQPSKEHVGRWTVAILATVAGEETTVISWSIEVI